MQVRHPKWLLDTDILASICPHGGLKEPSDELTDAVVLFGEDEGEARATWAEDDEVKILVLQVPLASSDCTSVKGVEHVAQYLARAAVAASVQGERAGAALGNATCMSNYVDRLVNMPRSMRTRDLVRWLSVRCAEWRCKLATLTADAAESRANHSRLGVPVDHGAVAPALERIRSVLRTHPDVVSVDRDLEQSAGLLDAATSVLGSAHELLDAMLATYRDEQGDKMQRSGYILSIAVTVTGLNALGGLLFSGSGDWDEQTSILATVLPALVPLAVLGGFFAYDAWLSRKSPAHGTAEDIEARINALVEGFANPVHSALHYVVPPLRDRIGPSRDGEEWVKKIERSEAGAAELLGSIVATLQKRWTDLDEGDVKALDATQMDVQSLRFTGLARLEQLARTQELTWALFGDFDIADVPFPDLAVTLWLYTPALGLSADSADFVEESFRSVLIDGLGRSPSEVARLLMHCGDVIAAVLGVPEGQDPWEYVSKEGEVVRATLAKLDPRDVVNRFADARLSCLLRGGELGVADLAEAV
jgi:hypothetical protein